MRVYRLFICLLLLSLTFSPSLCYRTEDFVTPSLLIEKSLTLHITYLANGSVKSAKATVTLKVTNNSSLPMFLVLKDRSWGLDPRGFSMLSGESAPDEVMDFMEYLLVIWRELRLAPHETKELRYEAPLRVTPPIELEELLYVNDKPLSPVKEGDAFKLPANASDIIKICLKLKNEDPRLFSYGRYLRRSFLISLSMDIDEERLHVTSVSPYPSLIMKGSEASTYSWNIRLEETSWVNITAVVTSLGTWNELMLNPISVNVILNVQEEELDFSNAQLESISRNMDQLKLLINILTPISDALHTTSEQLMLVAQELPSGSSSLKSSSYSLSEALLKVSEYLRRSSHILSKTGNDLDDVASFLTNMLMTCNSVALLNPPEELKRLYVAKYTLRALASTNRDMAKALLEISKGIEQLYSTTTKLSSELMLLKHQLLLVSSALRDTQLALNQLMSELNASLVRLQSSYEVLLASYKLQEFNYYRYLWGGVEAYPLDYEVKFTVAPFIRRISSSEWSLDGIYLDVHPRTTENLTIFVYGVLILLDNSSRLQGVKVNLGSEWRIPDNLTSLGIQIHKNKLYVPIYKEVPIDGISEVLSNVLWSGINLSIRGDKPKAKVVADIAVYPKITCVKRVPVSFSLSFEQPILSSPAKFIVPPIKREVAPAKNIYVIVVALLVLVVIALILFIHRRRPREEVDEELEELLKQLKDMESELKVT